MNIMTLKNRTIELMEQLDLSLSLAAYCGAKGLKDEYEQSIQQARETLSDLDIVKSQMGRLS